MEIHTINTFTKWDLVTDYESDENSVTLIGKNGEPLAEYNYPRFTYEDFCMFKNI